MNFSLTNFGSTIRKSSLSILLAGTSFAQSGIVVEVHKLPLQDLASFQNKALPGSVVTGASRGFKLGGVGSGLWHGPGDGPGIFWMITDRGPNPQDTVTGPRRAFPMPQFTPFILKVKAENGTITILQATPIKGTGGQGVTGLPNDPLSTSPATPYALGDEQPYNCSVNGAGRFSATIAGNHDGLDTEDIVRDVHGNFWTIEEYGPSIVKIDASGIVQRRFVPAGRKFVSGDHYPVTDNLPAILGRRQRNRGFEGLAITPDNKTLMAIVQSPLANPADATGKTSRVLRFIAFDIPSETVVAEYAYVMQPLTDFGTTDATAMKVSSIAALDQHRFLVDERTDDIAKLYLVDVRRATNILGPKWDSVPVDGTAVTLEKLSLYGGTDTLAINGVVTLPKELVVDLSSLRDVNGKSFKAPQKIEGMTVLDGKTIAISNDNDFQVRVGPPASCDPLTNGVDSQIMIIRLDRPIK